MRTETIEGVADIGIHFQNVDVFNKYLENIYFTFLKDKTYAVRELGLKKLKSLC